MKKSIFILALFISISSLGHAQFSYQDAVKKLNDMVGLSAPDFEGTTVTGKKVSLSSLKGKIVVINFWFVGCRPCEEEMPLLNELTRTYKNRDDIVFLSFAKTEEQKVKDFLEKNTFLYQTVASAKAIAEKYNVMAYPTQFVLDKTGIIRSTSIGGRDDIDKLLAADIEKIANR